MIPIIKTNWNTIKKAMQLSASTNLGWIKYSQNIYNGLPNKHNLKRGNGQLVYFLEKLPYYAKLDNGYLTIACLLTEEEIIFISEHREFLQTIE